MTAGAANLVGSVIFSLYCMWYKKNRLPALIAAKSRR
jgi:hypothetical protein